uniref:ATP synthase subunit a n=1 Tax=Stygobromus allegheniensis TaxID=1677011 RepID=A0A6C0X4Y1_9CRUS|nr:ATP synthase F0 subunit 6 [Stygobromus allegheniensis]QIC54422.1 ATP synthase F0 subunit 6 [Stygobromus allegheniensis]
MMANLFSIFDPSTNSLFSTNWFSLLSVLIFYPLTFWLVSQRIKVPFKNMMNYVYSEFKPLSTKTPFVLTLTLTIFTLILFNNLLGLLPFIFTASSHLVFTVTLALPGWLAILFFSLTNNLQSFLAHLVPQGTPNILMPFMVLIETISNLIRPITLAVRLTANMIAGHLLIVLLSSASSFTPLLGTPFLGTAQLALASLELAVAFIQAYVFSVLITLYIAETN